MKHLLRTLAVGAVLAAVTSHLTTADAQGTAFTYQGLLNSGGTPAANGLYDFRFRLFLDALGNTQAGSTVLVSAVPATNGLFLATVDFGPGIFNGTNYWLEIDVRTNNAANYTDLSPLQAVTPTPYAISASGVSGSVPAGQLTGSLPGSVLAGLYAGAVDFTNAGNSFGGNGSGLTDLSAAQLTGTIPDARLSTNVALLNGANQTSGTNVFGVPVVANTATATSFALTGANNAATGSSTGSGVYGQTSQSGGFGVFAENKNSGGTAIVAAGNGQTGLTVANGAGLAAYGLYTAVYAQANASSSSFTAVNTYMPAVNNQVLVNYYSGSVLYKIGGNGTVSTLVADATNQSHVMFAPEAPEVFFEDYGSGQLANGSAHIVLDTILAANIAVSPAHPLRVFVQVEGDCKGVYVANKTASGFDVIELGGGGSNVPFSWHVVANRADEEQITASKGADGKLNAKFVSHYSTQRFPVDRNFKSTWHAVQTRPDPQKNLKGENHF